MQSNGTVIALRNAPDKQLVTPGGEVVGGEPIVEEDPEPVPDGTGGYAPAEHRCRFRTATDCISLKNIFRKL